MKYTLTLVLITITVLCYSQTIEFTYDDAGNREKRKFIASAPNNENEDISSDNSGVSKEEENTHNEVVTSSLKGTEAIKLYPNPTKSSIEINLANQFNKDIPQRIEIIDLNGKVVQDFLVTQSVSVITFGGYRVGMYYVHFKENGVIRESWKVVKID